MKYIKKCGLIRAMIKLNTIIVIVTIPTTYKYFIFPNTPLLHGIYMPQNLIKTATSMIVDKELLTGMAS